MRCLYMGLRRKPPSHSPSLQEAKVVLIEKIIPGPFPGPGFRGHPPAARRGEDLGATEPREVTDFSPEGGESGTGGD